MDKIIPLSFMGVHSNEIENSSKNKDNSCVSMRDGGSEDVEESTETCDSIIKRSLPKVKSHVEFLLWQKDG